MSDGAGQIPKKETLYGGPVPNPYSQSVPPPPMVATQGTVYGGFTPAPRTQGTVYSGPSVSGATPAKSLPLSGGVTPQVVSGASWFYWIAGLSMVNAVILASGGHFHFILGLGITEVFSAIGTVTGSTAGAVVCFAINLVIAGVMVLFGFFASKGQKWAFIVGMVLYGLDGGIMLLGMDFLSVAFHGYALYRIYSGFRYTE